MMRLNRNVWFLNHADVQVVDFIRIADVAQKIQHTTLLRWHRVWEE